jgi:hypothetical protein
MSKAAVDLLHSNDAKPKLKVAQGLITERLNTRITHSVDPLLTQGA